MARHCNTEFRLFSFFFASTVVLLLRPSAFCASDDFSKLSKVVQSFQVEPFSGTSQAALPVTVPPGRRGLQPEINISYSSANPNSWVGVGWNLNLGYIERYTKNNSPMYDTTDKFYVNFMGISSELDAGRPDFAGEYFPHITPVFLRLINKGAYWQAEDKEGKIYLFGQTSNSRIETSKGTFRWALNKIIDTCGNYLTVSYSKDGYQIYPAKIEYNGNINKGEIPTHKVEFLIESRPDQLTSLRSGFNILTAKRLKEIKTYVGASLVNRYLFAYQQGRQSGRSLLNRFFCFGSDGITSLPAMTFLYKQELNKYLIVNTGPKSGNKLWWFQSSYGKYGNTSGTLNPKMAQFSEGGRLFWYLPGIISGTGTNCSVDAKGKLTVNLPAETAFNAWTYVYVENAKTISIPATASGNLSFWLNGDYSTPIAAGSPINLKQGSNRIEVTGYNFSGPCTFDLNYALSDNVVRMHSNQFILPQLAGDFNGDGLTDLATYYASSGHTHVSLSNGNGFQPTEPWWVAPAQAGGGGFPMYMTCNNLSLLLGNFNRDSLTDIQAINDSTQTELIVTSNKKFYDEGGGGPTRFPVKGNPFAADFNNDGITEIGLQAKDSNDILIGFCAPSKPVSSITTWLRNFAGTILIGDFNADGFIDLASYDKVQGKVTVALNNSRSFDSPAAWINNFTFPSTPTVADCNGDGQADLCYYDKASGKVFAAVSDGGKFLAPAVILSGFTLRNPDVILQTGDFNGDGSSDYYVFNPYTQETEIAYSTVGFTDLLLLLINGIGASSTIKYDSSVNYDNTHTSKTVIWHDLPFPVPVVKEVSISDGMGNSWKQGYGYRGGLFDTTSREFRGFAFVSITDSEGNVKEIYLDQGERLKGRPYQEDYKDSQGNIFLRVKKAWGINDQGLINLHQEDRLSYETGWTTYKTATTSYGYDIGDLKMLCEAGKVRNINYVRTNSMAKPSYMSEVVNGYNILSKKWLYYDSSDNFNSVPTKGLLTKEKICVASNGLSPDNDMEPENAIVTAYTYDDYGNQISITDADNHATSVKYDPQYHIYPIETKNALGQITGKTFDPKNGRLLSETDLNNQTTAYTYDVLGRLIKIVGPLDSTDYPSEIYEYNYGVHPIKVTKRYKTAYPSTYASEYAFYDGLGRLIETKVPADDEQATMQPRQIVKNILVYNRLGKISEKYNPFFSPESPEYTLPDTSIAKTAFEYDCLGRVTKIINPDLTSRLIEYSGWTQTKTDENSHLTRSTFDALNRLAKKEEFTQAGTFTTSYEYDLFKYDLTGKTIVRRVFKITDENNNISEIWFDTAGRKISMVDPDMGTWFYTYDRMNNLKTQKDALGRLITFTYDALNRLVKKQYSDGKSITYSYDSPSRNYSIGKISSIVDLAGSTNYFYDRLGRQVKLLKITGGGIYITEHSYNALGQVSTIKYPDREIVNYSYDKANHIKNITGAAPYITNVEYAPTGQITKIGYGNNAVSEYTFDPSTNRLTDVKTNNGALQNLHYQYDNAGNIYRISDYRNTATQDFSYDEINRLIQAAGAYGSFSYQYDPIGNIIYKEGTSFTYGQAGAKPHAVVSGSDGFTAAYDANGNMVARNDAVFTYDYDNRLVKFESLFPDKPVIAVIILKPGWNFISLPLLVDNNSISAVLSSIEGKYDQVSRYNTTTAKFEHYIAGQPSYSQFTTLENGRGYQIYATKACLLKFTGKVRSTAYTYPLKKGWEIIGYPSNSRLIANDALAGLVKGVNYDRFVRFDNVTGAFVEIAASEYLKIGQSYFIHMLKNSSWSVLPKQLKVEFAYNGDGSRVKKVTGESTTIYIDELYEKTGTIATKHIYLGENKACSITQGTVPETRYYHTDHLGSTNVVTNAKGEQVQLNEYSPFGLLSKAQPSSGQSLSYLFTGKELDTTGLYYYGARYYDPKRGRFITPDPIEYSDEGIKAAGGRDLKTFFNNPQNLNRYAYCLNNPLKFIDPSGLLVIFIHGTYSSRESFSTDFINSALITFNQINYLNFSWSGANSNFARYQAAQELSKIINSHTFSPNEPLITIGYSHGGNVAFLTSDLELKKKIDILVTLGTPLREYKPNMNNVGKIYNAYSDFDNVPTNPLLGGGIKKAMNNSININVPANKGSINSHGFFITKECWDKYIDPVIQNE